MAPILVWFRRDLRLSDHEALCAACDSGRPVIPVFICDESVEALGAAPKFRLGLSVGALGRALEKVVQALEQPRPPRWCLMGRRTINNPGNFFPNVLRLVSAISRGTRAV